MGTIDIKPAKKKVKVKGKIRTLELYNEANLEKFRPSLLLGLGNIGARSRQIHVIAIVFDLAGFTRFCSQADPHLSIPMFLKEFLKWLFESIKSGLEVERFEQGVRLYSDLPFFAKFTGDGVLFLWDTKDMDIVKICNIVAMMGFISDRYRDDFAPSMKKHLTNMPESIRCGVARGLVCSVGNGKDYVGPCINLATRLQKLSNLGSCCSKKGIDMDRGMTKAVAGIHTVKIVKIRGIVGDELVIVRKKEFRELSEEDKAIFKDA